MTPYLRCLSLFRAAAAKIADSRYIDKTNLPAKTTFETGFMYAIDLIRQQYGEEVVIVFANEALPRLQREFDCDKVSANFFSEMQKIMEFDGANTHGIGKKDN